MHHLYFHTNHIAFLLYQPQVHTQSNITRKNTKFSNPDSSYKTFPKTEAQGLVQQADTQHQTKILHCINKPCAPALPSPHQLMISCLVQTIVCHCVQTGRVCIVPLKLWFERYLNPGLLPHRDNSLCYKQEQNRRFSILPGVHHFSFPCSQSVFCLLFKWVP